MNLRTQDFYYELPGDLIAQIPLANREDSRLMVLSRHNGKIIHSHFAAITEFLTPGDLIVMNNVRVIPARLFTERSSGGQLEILILDGWKDRRTRVLFKPARRIRIGEKIQIDNDWYLEVLGRNGPAFDVTFDGPGSFYDLLNRNGVMPVPPYISRSRMDDLYQHDKIRYQTVYASVPGAIAAPTAGLHFSDELLINMKKNQIESAFLTLFVGWGTFKSVDVEFVKNHTVDPEPFSIDEPNAQKIKMALKEKRRIIAVGTTTVRALESWIRSAFFPSSIPMTPTDLFIHPGFEFKIVNSMITNFHLPCSSLLMLVSAFWGREKIIEAYRLAVSNRYRFFSYGDAMFLS